MDPQVLALFLAGIITPFVTQLLKSGRIADRPAQWLAIVVSYILALLAFVLTGGTPNAEEFIAKGAAVAALALTIYRQVIKPHLAPEVVEE